MHLNYLQWRVMKILLTHSVRASFAGTMFFALGIVHAGPPAQPADPAADQWVQNVEQAYANTQTYQSTGTASIIQSSDVPEEEIKHATMNTADCVGSPQP